MTAQTDDKNRSQDPPATTPKQGFAGPVIAFGFAAAFGIGALVSGLFTVLALVGPFVGTARSEEYPESLPPPAGAEVSAPDFIGPLVLLVLFGPITVVLLRATYAAVRSGLGKSPIPVITPGIGWLIAIVFGGSALLVCVYGATQGEWATALEAAGTVPLFFTAPFLAKSFRRRADAS